MEDPYYLGCPHYSDHSGPRCLHDTASIKVSLEEGFDSVVKIDLDLIFSELYGHSSPHIAWIILIVLHRFDKKPSPLLFDLFLCSLAIIYHTMPFTIRIGVE